MAGSIAEERIRAKVEASLRREFPDARIVHELNVQQGVKRLDLAAVRRDGLTLVEIKSERDTLSRMQSQIAAALKITGDVRVYAAEKHRAALLNAGREHLVGSDGKWIMHKEELGSGRVQYRYEPNPAYVRELNAVLVLIEGEDGFEPLEAMHASWWPRRRMGHTPDARAVFDLMWNAEQVAALASAGCTPASLNRQVMTRAAFDHMSGGQILRAACAALRARTFARADEQAA